MMQSPGINRLTPRKHKGLRPFVSIGLLLLCALIMFGQIFISTSFAARASTHAASAYTVNGTVFNDYNQNGAQDSQEPGLNGIVVTAYDASNQQVATTTTASNTSGTTGQYALSIPAGVGPVRLQFTGFGPGASNPRLAALQPSAPGSAGTTPVAFVSGAQASNTVNLGLEVPGDYCQQNPNIVTNCYIQGDQSGTDPVLVRFPYNAKGDDPDKAELGLAASNQVGPTWGLAYRRSSDSLFASAFMKRLAPFPSGGNPGAIYLVSQANSSTPGASATPFVTLSAGTDKHNPYDANQSYVDGSAYDAVGKTSLGGLALSDDEATLYAMNLFDKSLYSIPLGAAPAAPVAGTPSAVAVPAPADCPDVATNFRPFAVTDYEGLVYVGAVCSAETTQKASDLHAYVFQFDPVSKSFQSAPIFEFGLNYARGCAITLYDQKYNSGLDPSKSLDCTKQFPGAWNPWLATFNPYKTTSAQTQYTTTSYPQPMLTGIAFDQGNLILGLRDRFGEQGGRYAAAPDGTGGYIATTAGDLLRACLNTPGDLSAGWALENNGSCGGVTTAGAKNGEGPGGGEYYYQESFSNIHTHVSLGGVLQIPGLATVQHTTMDPTDNVNTAGTHTTSNATGEKLSAYQLYDYTVPNTFAKSNGLGSLVAFCQSAPLQIGNRVWLDQNGNGIQDASEPGIAGVTVNLYDTTGKLVSTTKTDANGNYYFSVKPYTNYVVKLDNPADYAAGGPLHDLKLAPANQGNDPSINSHGMLATAAQPAVAAADQRISAGNYPQMVVSAHTPGQNDYTFNTGFVPPIAPDLAVTITSNTPNPQVGQPLQYTLTVNNTPGAGPVPPGQPITVTFTPPAGLSNVTATDGSDWTLTVDPTTGKVIGTYVGPYPVNPGQTLTPIIITGTPTQPGKADASATVSTPNDSNLSNNTATTSLNIAPVPTSVKFWVQTLDGCQFALPGAVYILQGNGLFMAQGPGQGDAAVKVGSANPCPLQHGDCVAVTTGCLSWDLPVSATGTTTYTITEVVPSGGYKACLYSTGCKTAPEVIFVTVDATGKVSATTKMADPKGSIVSYPADRSSFSGTQTDPALFYNSKIVCPAHHSCCCCRHPLAPGSVVTTLPGGRVNTYPAEQAVANTIAQEAVNNTSVANTIAHAAYSALPALSSETAGSSISR